MVLKPQLEGYTRFYTVPGSSPLLCGAQMSKNGDPSAPFFGQVLDEMLDLLSRAPQARTSG